MKHILILAVNKFFYFFERVFGIHILPVYFYSPVPDTRSLLSKDFNRKFNSIGIDWKEKEQLDFLKNEIPLFNGEFDPYPNSGLSLFDCLVLYGMVRKHKPKNLFEIGFGESSKIIHLALEKNRSEGFDSNFVSVDPYPSKQMIKQTEQFHNFKFIQSKVEDLDLDEFKDCDFLFIDSSYVSKFGSDVNYEILELIPSLSIGSIIHWHDIMFPKEYPIEWIKKSAYFWNESYMVGAFLSFNNSFEIQWSSKFMHIHHESKLAATLKSFRPNHNISSLWIRRVK